MKYEVGTCWTRCFTYLGKAKLVKEIKAEKLEFYEYYIIGKQTKVKFVTTVHGTEAILDYVHANTWDRSRQFYWEVGIGLSNLLVTTRKGMGAPNALQT